MDQNEPPAFPFQVIPSETRFYLYKNVKAHIIGQNEVKISLVPLSGNLLITDQRLCYFNDPKNINELTAEDQQLVYSVQNKHGQDKTQMQLLNIQGKSFMFKYKDLVSHGLQGEQFICFLGADEEEMQIEEEEQLSLVELIEQKDNQQIVSIERGEYQIYFDLAGLSKQEQEELFNNFSELATADESEHDSGDMYDQMITADNIDNEGNIVFPNQEQNDNDNDDDYEDEDDDQENGQNEKYL